MIFLSSDQHYGHLRIIELCNRPFKDVLEMNEHLIQEYNKTVSQNDICYFLGDFSFCKDINDSITILSRLNGEKHLILGNHDYKIKKNMQSFLGKNLFNTITDELMLDDIKLSHYPDNSNTGMCAHGHTHGNKEASKYNVDIGVDSKVFTYEYKPIAFDEVKQFFKEQNYGS